MTQMNSENISTRPFFSQTNTPFSVNNCGEIGKISFSPFHKRLQDSVPIIGVLSFKIHRKRLNPENSYLGICDSLNLIVISRGRSEEVSPPKLRVNKATERTAATVPLTDGQTPSGDQLSVTDFKAEIQWLTRPAIEKSALIDLELLAA